MTNTLIVSAVENLPGRFRLLCKKDQALIDAFEKAKATGNTLSINVYGKPEKIAAIFVTDSNGTEITAKADHKNGQVKAGEELMQVFTQTKVGQVTWTSEPAVI